MACNMNPHIYYGVMLYTTNVKQTQLPLFNLYFDIVVIPLLAVQTWQVLPGEPLQVVQISPLLLKI